MQNIITAMKKQNVRRLVITSTLSAKDPNDPLNFRTKAMVNLVKVTMPDAYKDIVSTAETVRNSDLDWTIVRLTMDASAISGSLDEGRSMKARLKA
jgi:hypothetical protein